MVFYLLGDSEENEHMVLKTVKETRLANARLLQQSLKGGQDEMCAKIGKSQSQVSSFMGANPTKGIGNKIAREIEIAFDLEEGWMDSWHDLYKEHIETKPSKDSLVNQDHDQSTANQNTHQPTTRPNVAPAPSNKEKLYPVISWVHAGAWAEAVDLYQPGCADQWETTDSNVSDRSFWLKVVGDSMTALSGPSIPEGHLILVDPDATPINGSLVIAKLTDHQEVTFKKLVIDADHKYLKPLNPNYETTKINGNCQIVGVVKEAKIKF